MVKRTSKKEAAVGPVTIRTVAAEAGVSTATVSRALAGSNAVRSEVRQRVIEAVEKFDYHPNKLARGLRAGRGNIIGVIIPDLQNPFLTGVVYGIESVLYEAGYVLVLGHSDGFAEREQAQIRTLRGEGAAGLILIPDNGPGAAYESIEAWGVPAIAVDRQPQGLDIDLISTDHAGGAKRAVAHFLSHGYRDIALINGPPELSVAQQRLAGYREALQLAGLPIQEALVVSSNFRQDGGRSAMGQLLNQRKPPRAVLVANNLMALGALQMLQERKVRVPEDVAIIGFDDMPWADLLHPPLSAVVQPIKELGRMAAEMLLARIKDRRRLVRQIILPPELIVRRSCGGHPVGNKDGDGEMSHSPIRG